MELETLWDRVRKGFLGSASTAAERAGYFGKIGRARHDIAGTRHAIREAFAELGGLVYGHLGREEGIAVDQRKDVQDLVRKIRDLEALLQDREARLLAIKTGADGPGEEVDEGSA